MRVEKATRTEAGNGPRLILGLRLRDADHLRSVASPFVADLEAAAVAETPTDRELLDAVCLPISSRRTPSSP